MYHRPKLGNKEHYKVFVGVVEVTGIELVIVVEELCLCVVVGGYSLVKVANTKGIAVEHHTEHTTDGNLVVSACLDIDSRSMSKAVVLACTLPRSNGPGGRKCHLAVVGRQLD